MVDPHQATEFFVKTFDEEAGLLLDAYRLTHNVGTAVVQFTFCPLDKVNPDLVPQDEFGGLWIPSETALRTAHLEKWQTVPELEGLLSNFGMQASSYDLGSLFFEQSHWPSLRLAYKASQIAAVIDLRDQVEDNYGVIFDKDY